MITLSLLLAMCQQSLDSNQGRDRDPVRAAFTATWQLADRPTQSEHEKITVATA
jgi:hypothetical protein